MDIDVESMTEDQVDAVWVGLHAAETVLSGDDDVVLGLDLGTRFGWAIVNGRSEILDSGWYDTARRGESPGMARLRFKKTLHELIETIQPTAVYYENPSGAFRGHGGKVIQSQAGILEAELTEIGMPYGGVHQGTLKKWATGKGNASKDAMRKCLAERLGAP